MMAYMNRLFSGRAMAFAVCVVAMCAGMAMFFQSSQDWPPDSTRFYSAALMMAAGKGYQKPAMEPASPTLDRFFALEEDALPPHVLADVKTSEGLPTFQARHRYLGYAVALAWWLFGTSWHSLRVMLVVFLALSAVLVYRLFRLGMPPLASAGGAMLFAVSPLVLTVLPSIRDFSKAPIMLGILLVLAVLSAHSVEKRRYYGLALLLGALVGVGLGFRHDFVICLPAALVVLAFCRVQEAPVRIRARLAAMGLALAAAVLVASPILVSLAHTGNMGYHHAIMGLASSHEQELGMGQAFYELMPDVDDRYSHAVRSSYNVRVLGGLPTQAEMPDSARAGKHFLLDYATTFPADLLTRAYAATLYLLGGAPVKTEGGPAVLFVERMGNALGPLCAHFGRYGLLYAAAALCMIAAYNLHTGFLAAFVLLYFTGYTSMQFQLRHCFHLAFLPYGLFLFVWYHAGAALWRCRRKEWRAGIGPALRHGGRRAAVFAVVMAAVLGGGLLTARLYQRWQVGGLLERYQEAQLAPAPTRRVPLEEGWVLFEETAPPPLEMPEAWREQLHGYELRGRYLMVALDADARYRTVRFAYEAEDWVVGFFTEAEAGPLGGGGGEARFFFPVYEYFEENDAGSARFRGVALPEEHADEFKGLYRVVNERDFPMLLYLTVPPDPSDFGGYKPLFGSTAAQ